MRDAVYVSSLAELLPAAESTWARELALVEAAPSRLAAAIEGMFTPAQEQDEPPPSTASETAAVRPPS